MSGISKYKYQNSKFDTEDELMKLELIRLVLLQKIQLENINNCINEIIIDKNDLQNILQEIIITNKVLDIKLKMKSNLYRILLENKRVNHYTKLLIMLNTYNHFKDYYIPNKKLTRILKIDKKNLIVLLHQLQDDNIIKLYYVGKKRYFKFNLEEEKKNNDIFHYDWLNDDDD